MDPELHLTGGGVPLESHEFEFNTNNEDPDDLKIQEFARRMGQAMPNEVGEKKRPSVPRTVSLNSRVSFTEQRPRPRRSSSSYELLVRQTDMFNSFVADARRDFQPNLPKRHSASPSLPMPPDSMLKRASIISAISLPSDMGESTVASDEEPLKRTSIISVLTNPTELQPDFSEDTIESKEVDRSIEGPGEPPRPRTSDISALTTPTDLRTAFSEDTTIPSEEFTSGGQPLQRTSIISALGMSERGDDDEYSVASGDPNPAFLENMSVTERLRNERENAKAHSDEAPSQSKLALHQSALTKLARKFREGVPVANRIYHFKKYVNTFVGSEAIDFMVNSGMVETREDAVFLAQRFVRELNLFHHVYWDHTFLKDDYLFYRFTDGNTYDVASSETPNTALEAFHHSSSIDETTGEKPTSTLSTANSCGFFAQDLQVAAEKFQKAVPVFTHTHHFVKYKNTFSGSEAVDKMLEAGIAKTRNEAVFLGQRLAEELSLFAHVKFHHPFKDENLFYRYLTDKGQMSPESSPIQSQERELPVAPANLRRWSLRASFTNQWSLQSQSSDSDLSSPLSQPRRTSNFSLRSSVSSQQSSLSQLSSPLSQTSRASKSSLRSSFPTQMPSYSATSPIQRQPPLVRGWSEPSMGQTAPRVPVRHGSIVATTRANGPSLPAMAEGEEIQNAVSNSRFEGVGAHMDAPAIPVRNNSIVSGMLTNAAQLIQDIYTDDDWSRASSRRQSCVSFGALQIRVYDRCLDLNPSTSSGPSIGLGWSYEERGPLSLSDEKKSPGNGGFRLSRSEREDILEDCGYSRKEIARAVRQNSKAKEKRRDTLNRLSARSMARR